MHLLPPQSFREIMSRPEKNSTVGSKPVLLTITEDNDGQRVDNFLISILKGVPKKHIYRIIRKGEVRVNKGRVRQTSRLKQGDIIRVPPVKINATDPAQISVSKYQFLRDEVLYEDDYIMVLNKPSGMAVHAGSGIAVGVIEALRALRTDLRYLELAHRLDRETSGCLVLSKSAKILKILNEDFRSNTLKNKRLDKRYLALVKGRWRHGERRIEKPLDTEARRGGERHVIVSAQGSYASSIVVPREVGQLASLVEVKLQTGRTHQVRVHLDSEGHPLAGDQRYGDVQFNQQMKEQHGLRRLFLHASEIALTHPESGARLRIDAPLPEALKKVSDELRLEKV